MMKKNIIKTLLGIVAATGFFTTLSGQTQNDGLRAYEFEKYESAKGIFMSLVQQANDKTAENYYYLGQVFEAQGKNDSAAWAYNAGITANPLVGQNYAGLGGLKLKEDKAADAEPLFTKGLEMVKKKNFETLKAIARAYYAADKKYADKALEYANKALEANNKDADTYILIGDIYLKKAEGNPDGATLGSQAATNYDRAIYYNPTDPEPYTKQGFIWLKAKSVDPCLTSLKKAIELDSNYAPAHKLLSDLYYLANQFDKSRAEYEKFLDLSERSADNMRQYVNILFLGGFYADALDVINTLLASDNSDVYLQRLKAYSIYEVGVKNKIETPEHYVSGITSIETFLSKIAPDKIMPSDYAYYGKLQVKAGMDSLAAITLQKAIDMDPGNPDLYFELGQVKNKQKKYAEAALSFQAMIDKKAKPSVIDYYYLARAYYFGNQFGKSDTAWGKLLELKNDYADAYWYRGSSNARLDPQYKDTLARYYYEKYVELATKDEASTVKNKKNLIDAYTYLGVYYVQTDKNAGAKTYFTKLLAIDPENKTAKDALKNLK